MSFEPSAEDRGSVPDSSRRQHSTGGLNEGGVSEVIVIETHIPEIEYLSEVKMQ